MAGWEMQGFEKGWGGTGRTFLSHYKRLEPLGKHPKRLPARTLGPAAWVLLASRCCAHGAAGSSETTTIDGEGRGARKKAA